MSYNPITLILTNNKLTGPNSSQFFPTKIKDNQLNPR